MKPVVTEQPMVFRADRFVDWLKTRSGRRVVVDLVVIVAFAVVVRAATFNMNLFERLYDFSRQHEGAQVDELMVTLTIASLAFVAFGVRRVQDQRRELALRHAAERHALMLAEQDQLTGLPNRRRFYETLSAIKGDDDGCALFLLDLDGFKQVNDVFGHAAGDAALKAVAQRLRSISDERMLPARLGGDEFALLAHNVVNADETSRIAQNLIDAIDAPIITAGVEQMLNVSVGIALIEECVENPEEYLRRADTALYRAKREPGSSFATYEPWMDRDLTEQVKLERDLVEALAAKEIVPHYQPIVDLKTGQILKFEALARWRHKTRGDVAPTIFVALAEDRGHIAQLTEMILEQACRDACAWPSNIELAVNLSPVLIQSSAFGLKLAKILAETGLAASRLELEITEKALRADADLVQAFLENLRSLGVRIALDDFGTGYSSLSRLRRLPFDELKIDGSFVQSMSKSADRMLFVRTILELGHGLGLRVTAEGIEEPEQRQLLLAEGCTQGQGFLFSKAVPPEAVLHLLEEQKKTAARGRTAV
jgi:diguanylate cyclase (GGDEF)-like protein